MRNVFLVMLSLALILGACSLPITPPAPPSPATITVTATAMLPSYADCGYQWAYQGLPELSAEFQQTIQSLQPEAQANAFVFGEDCIHADGTTKTFIPMETDFSITLQVIDPSDEAALGG